MIPIAVSFFPAQDSMMKVFREIYLDDEFCVIKASRVFIAGNCRDSLNV